MKPEINKSELTKEINEMGGVDNYIHALNWELWLEEEKGIKLNINTPLILEYVESIFKN
jgi:hypothetical protein